MTSVRASLLEGQKEGATVTVGDLTGRLCGVALGGGPTLTRGPWVGMALLPTGQERARWVEVPADTTVEVTPRGAR